MRAIFSGLLITSIAVLAPATSANTMAAESLQQCRGIVDASARLRCYDALPVTVDVKPAAATSNVQPGQATLSAAQSAAAAVSQFGIEEKKLKDAAPAIDSQIMGLFEGWRPNSRIKLANGQVWQVSDDSSRSLELNSPKVTIRRGVLGAFFLELEGTNYSPRVKRVQ